MDEGKRKLPFGLWVPAAIATVGGWALILVSTWVVLNLYHWFPGWFDLAHFPTATVVSVMATWGVAVLVFLAALEVRQDLVNGPPPRIADRYLPTWPPLWWVPPLAALLGLALGWAFWK